MRAFLLLFLSLSSCTLFVLNAGPETCEANTTIQCDGNTLVVCDQGIKLLENCGSALDCNEAEARCGSCGDGIRDDRFEACDDGNSLDGDGCEADCSAPFCGNGILDQGELCDDGNDIPGDGCEPTCSLITCGNGAIEAGEECDDANNSDFDACLSSCVNARCGDGIIQSGVESCEPPGAGGCSDTCLLGCQNPQDCVDQDACTQNERCIQNACVSDPVDPTDPDPCTVDSCDPDTGISHDPADDGTACNIDQNNNTKEFCIAGVCNPSACGDGIVAQSEGEQCDDGNTDNTDACTTLCEDARCGDGFVEAGAEECDDGNGNNNDGCSNNCLLLTACGNNTLEAPEQCEGANLGGQSCTSLGFAGGTLSCNNAQCTFNTSACVDVCGNGNAVSPETCDDGNQNPNDGCSADCQVEADLFVLCDGSTGGVGTLEDPFRSLTTALVNAQNNDVIMILPQSTEACSAVTITNKRVTLQGLADPTAANPPARPTIEGNLSLSLGGAAGQIVVRDLILRSNLQSGTVSIGGATQAALLRVDVSSTSATAIAITCNSNNNDARLLIDQSVVHDSIGGALRVQARCRAVVSNSLFLDNGTSGSAVGVASVEGNNARLHIIHTNSIGNQAQGAPISCENANTGRVEASILSDASLDADCFIGFTNSINATPPGGNNNISEDPLFVDQNVNGFLLGVGSLCVDAANAPSLGFSFDPAVIFGQSILTHDLHGGQRPLGLAPDMGAVETR